MSTVKVGDRVRATCGESVIVGTVSSVYPRGISVDVDGDEHRYYMVDGMSWTVEVVAPPIPNVAGTIVRDRNGEAWQRRAHGWYMADDGHGDYGLDDLQIRYGPLTVLWTPEP